MSRYKPFLFRLLLPLMLLCLSLVAIWPLTQGQMLLTDDGTLHLYRTIVLDHSLRNDDALYPRYSSALAYGYGAPLFTYFSPAAYYLPRTLHLFGVPFQSAWLWSMVLYLWLALGGAYALGRTLTTRWGGLLAAVSYLYAPYLLYDAISRGTITEVAALAMLPWVLAALTRLAQQPSARRFALALLSYTLLIPLHNIVTLHGSLLIAAYCLFLVLKSPARRPTLIRLVSVGVFSLAITAFFWLPALAETSRVKINAVTASLPALDVTQHLRPLSAVLALPIALDPQQQQAAIPITVSWLALALGGVALLGRARRGQALFWWGVVLVTLFMNTPASAWLWQHGPLLNYTQFAWRVLGMTSLALAVLAALGTATLLHAVDRRAGWCWLIPMTLVALTILYGLPFTYRPTVTLATERVQDAQAYERLRGEIALSSYSEYLPAWTVLPLEAARLEAAWAQREIISRLPADAPLTVLAQSWRGTRGEVSYRADVAPTLVLNWLYMPQWSAQVDGTPLTVMPDAAGLVQLSLPAGQHTFTIAYTLSPLQQAASWISGLALLMAGGVIVLWRRRQTAPPALAVSADGGWPLRMVAVLVLLGGGLLLLRLTLIDTTDNVFHQQRWQNDTFAGVPVRGDRFGSALRLLAANAPEVITTNPPAVTLDTFWTLSAPVAERYGVVYRLVNAAGLTVAEQSRYQIAALDTTRWQPGLYLHDSARLELPRGTPPGLYTLVVAVYDTETLAPLPTINAAGNPDVPQVTLADITLPRLVTRADTIPAGDAPIAVLSVSGVPTTLLAGTPFTLTIEYAAPTAPTVRYTAQLVALQNDQRLVVTPATDLVTDWPTTEWQAGEVWTAHTPVILRPLPTTAAGTATLTLALELSDSDGLLATLPLGSVVVETPARVLTAPVTDASALTRWQNGIELVGYTLDDRQVTLVWRTDRLLTQDLRLFVHVLAADETILAQRDGMPVDWTRPTTSWVTEEYITTSYTFAELGTGDYRVRLGWYDPLTFQRVAVGAADSLTLGNRLAVR